MKGFSIYVIACIIVVAGPLLARSDDDDDRHGHGYGHKKHDQCESLVLDWSDWGPCSVPCDGVGLQLRARQMVQSQSCDSQEVPCPIPGTWSTWADVGGCSVTCGSGEQVQKRECVDAETGATCIDEDGNPALEEWKTVTCDEPDCVVCNNGYTSACEPCENSTPPADVFCRIKSYRFASVQADKVTVLQKTPYSPYSEDRCSQGCVNTAGCRGLVYHHADLTVECSTYTFESTECTDILGDVEQVSSDIGTGDVRLHIRREEFPGQTCPDDYLEFDPQLLTINSVGFLYPYVAGGDFCRADGYQLNVHFTVPVQNGLPEEACIQACARIHAECRLLYAYQNTCRIYYNNYVAADFPDPAADVIPNGLAGAVLMLRKEEFLGSVCPSGSSPQWTVVTP